MRCKILHTLLWLGMLLVGCAPKATPEVAPTLTALPSPTPLPLPTATPFPAELTATLDESVDPDQFGEDKSIVVRFSQPMNPKSASVPLIFSPWLLGNFSWSDDLLTLTFTPTSKMNPNVEYKVTVARALATVAGETFFYQPGWSITAETSPKIISRQPGGPDLPLGVMSFTLIFSQEMNRASVEAALSVEPVTPLVFTWEGRSLKVMIDRMPSPNQEFTFMLGNTAITTGGKAMERATWSYRTPPLAVQFDREESPSRLAPFRVAFNYPMDSASVEKAFSVDPAFHYKTAWYADKKTMTVIPLEPVPSSVMMTFTINAGVNLDLAHSKFSQTQSWTYNSPASVDSFEVRSRENLPMQLLLRLNIALDPQSAAAALHTEPSFAYQTSWSDGDTLLVISPKDPLPSLTKYTLWFEGVVRDADGFPLSDLGTYHFITPSPIVNGPQTGASDNSESDLYFGSEPLNPEDDFLVVFDRAMDPTTTLAALTITPTIPGEWVWLDSRRLQIIPSAGHLEEYTEYQLTLAPRALDANGVPVLEQAYTWKVATAGLLNHAGFGDYGASVQVVDLDGRRAIQIAAERGLEAVQLDLYRITVAQFIDFIEETDTGRWASRRAKQPFDITGAAHAASWSSKVVYANGESQNVQAAEIYLPQGLDEGLYVLNLNTDHLDDQLLVVASRSTIAVKYGQHPDGGGPFMAWVSNINGFVMQDVDVRVYDRGGVQIASGVTDDIGVYETNLPAGVEPYLVVARKNGGITVAGVGGVWSTRGWSSVRQKVADRYFVYLYTERPIYRPGQTVAYKGIVRRDDDVTYRLPPDGLSATLNVRDARDNLVTSQPVKLSDFGTFNGSFEIAEGAMLGSYALQLVIDEGGQRSPENHRQSFKVQDYKKPDIAVTLTTDQDEYVAGDTVQVAVEARYLFGEPVANASLKASFYELLPKELYCCNDVSQADTGGYDWIPSGIRSITLVADENGHATFTVPAQIGEVIRSYYYDGALPLTTAWGVEVTADDGSHQEVSTFTVIKVYNHAAEAHLDLGGWLFSPGVPIPLTVALTSQFGDPVAGQGLALDVQQYLRSSYGYVSAQNLSLTTDESGVARLDLVLGEGAFRLVLTGKDSRSNEFECVRWVYVHDFTSTGLMDYTTDLALKAEERDYLPGETAQVVVETSFTGEGLLTIERGGILEQRMVRLQAPFTVINIPIKASYAPNVYVVVQAWKPVLTDLTQSEWAYESIPDGILRWDAVELSVPDRSHVLTVEIQPDKDSYAPGEEATFSLRVTDRRGDPVRAEVSLALVDEAIYLLADDPAGDIHDAFYRPRPLGVFYSDSLAPWRYLWFDEGGRGGGGDDTQPGNPRTDFPDTALWLPAIVTDADGQAKVSLTLPDSLTSWRMTAKAVTRNTLIGEGRVNILTQQPVVVRPLPPRDLTAGDAFILAALVHNYSPETLALDVTMRAEGIEPGEAGIQKITLSPGSSRLVSWPVTASGAGEATFTIVASSSEGYGDAVQMHVPVQPLMVPRLHSETGQFSGETSLIVTPETGALPESRVRVEVDATVAGSLLNGVEYLTGYPYGCVEQTMSRALPNAVVARAFEQLGMGTRADLLGLEGKLSTSVQRLYAFQHDDGGWGWWYDDASDGYQTAWVVFGLAVTAESGYPVDADVLERGVSFLRQNLDSMNLPTRALASYAITVAGHGDVDLAYSVAASSSELDLFSRAALALTFQGLGEYAIANQTLDGLLDEVEIDPQGNISAPVGDEDGTYHRKFMSSSIRTTAMILRAVMAIRPDSADRAGLVQWLLSQRREYGWGTTNETAFTLLALTDHLLAQQNLALDSSVTIYLNGSVLITGTFSAENLMVLAEIPVRDLAPGENEIRFVTDAIQSLYYVVASEMFIGQAEVTGEGLLVTREYLDPATRQPVKEVQAGDLVLIRLSVEMHQTAYYVMLADHLPAGLEALNEGLNITGHDAVALGGGHYDGNRDPFSYDDYGYNQKEIRAGQVIFFITELGQGKGIFEYYARATVAGTFTALPAELNAMYDATVWGRSASEIFQINNSPEPGRQE